MAMPCSPGLNPQSDWMVFSAPEITTVSKPKRNPASADVSDQKKMRAFIVVETALTKTSTAGATNQRISLLSPLANPAVHRNDVGISHLLEIVSSKRGPETAAAI